MNHKIGKLTMEKIYELDAVALQAEIARHFKETRRKFVQTEDFIYSAGSVPIMLVAHMDTVHKKTAAPICKSDNGDIWMSPNGIGGDDRNGIWIILNILQRHNVHVLFTQGEEIGCVGASAFVSAKITPEINFMVEIDRKGADDAVFYECGNKDFKNFVLETTGYIESFGTFSDISVLSPWIDVASVNLSSGYYNPHLSNEFISLSDMHLTMEAVEELIAKANPSRKFPYMGKYTKTYSGKTSKKNSNYGYYDAKWDCDDEGYFDGTYNYFGKKKEKETTETKNQKKKKEEFDESYPLPIDDETYAKLLSEAEQEEFLERLDVATYDYAYELTDDFVDEHTIGEIAMSAQTILWNNGYLDHLL